MVRYMVRKKPLEPPFYERSGFWRQRYGPGHQEEVILNDEEDVIFETPTKRLLAWERQTLVGYLDATNLNKNEYDVSIKLRYGGVISKYEGKISVIKDKESFSTTQVTLLIVLVLVVIIVIDIFIIKRKTKHTNKDGNNRVKNNK